MRIRLRKTTTRLAAVWATTLAACGSPPEPVSSRRVVGDTIYVHNTAPQVGDTLVPREVSRIGTTFGPLEYVFGDIAVFTVAPSGHTFVYDIGSALREYDAAGSFVKYVTRRGEGPGEMTHLNGASASADGRVAFHDLGNRTLSIFSERGLLRTFRTAERTMPVYSEDAVSFHHDGSLWLGINPPFPAEGGIPYPRPIYARVNEDDLLIDTIWTQEGVAEACPVLSTREFAVGFWEDKRDPFVPKAKWALGPDGTLVLGCPADYRFAISTTDGRRIVVSRAWQPLRMPDEPRRFFVSMGRAPEMPEERPAYARIVVPGDGRIWVWPSQPAVRYELAPDLAEASGIRFAWELRSHGAFDVFTDEGVWLATVRLPPEARYSGYPTEPDVFIRGDTLWAVADDSLGAQSIVRYQVDGREAASSG